MSIRFFLPIAAVLVVACNNSAEKSPATDTTAKTTDTMQSMAATSSSVPALPAVPAGAKVHFKNLKDGQTVSSPVKVEMAVENMKVDTAGPVLAGSGHYHILVDAEDSLSMGSMVPKDSTHLHYGKAQTEANLPLAPGKHKLTLQFADGLHRSYGGQLATTVNITVKK